MMKSIGVFWKKDDDRDYCKQCPHHKMEVKSADTAINNSDEDFDFQINLWNSDVKSLTSPQKRRFRAIDFGIICPLCTKKLVLLLPFKADESDFHDLARCLSLDADLLCTVFNEDLKSTSEPSKSYYKIDGKNINLLMYELSKENLEEFIYDEQANVTQITITINSNFNTASFKDYRLFVRFRIMLKSFDSFAKKKKVSNDWLQSAFSSTYMFDIRLNDVRELSKKKKELVEFNGFKLPNFSKVHFFYMADSEESVENGSSIKLDKRLLENDRWHSYLGDKIEFVSENIAHHWKCKKEIKLGIPKVDTTNPYNPKFNFLPDYRSITNFTLFFKTEFSDCQIKRLILYVIIVMLLGFIASAFVTLIDSLLSCLCVYKQLVWGTLIIILCFILYFCLRSSTK